MEGGMPPSPSLNYLSASLAFFHQQLSLGQKSFDTGMCVERAAKIKPLFLQRAFPFRPVGRTNLTQTQENYYAKPVPRTGKVLSHPH